MQSLHWYMNRLGRMSPAELGYRITQAAQATRERWVIGPGAAVPPAHAPQEPAVLMQAPTGIDSALYVERANRIAAGNLSIFDLKDVALGLTPEWNRDPLTHVLAPLRHGSMLDYRDQEIVGDIKYLWELNRHLHIAGLAQAYALTGELRYAQTIRRHIESWIEQCPCGYGPNWSSSLELAIRLINWSLAWQWLGGADAAIFHGTDGAAFRERWLASVYQQTRAITRKLSRFSSANNHLIGEAAGAWIASVTWDYWPDMREWGLRCRQILLDEMLRQNADDGGNREQAFAYQQFVLDFLLLSGLAARGRGEDFPQDYWRRMERMLEFTASMMDAGGRLPMVGDADDGYVTSLSPAPAFDNFRSLLATGALLFGREDLAAKAGALDDKTRWLLGTAACAAYPRQPRREFTPRRAFPDSGYYLLGDRFDSLDEVRMLVDAGPLGFLSIAAHGHADALAVVLSVGGCEVLVDPGTYAYHTQLEWRDYFRSTRAHNTVVVDGCDQSRQAGAFMWSRHAHAKCTRFDASGVVQRFVGEHDGYAALPDSVTHRREITYDSAARSFSIVDEFVAAGAHEVERRWHFAEGLTPIVSGSEMQVRAGRHIVRLSAGEPPDAISRFEGGTASEGGWVSRSFGRKVPATTVAWRSHIQGGARLLTQISICEAEPSSG